MTRTTRKIPKPIPALKMSVTTLQELNPDKMRIAIKE